jgi:hypothetical protein
VVCESQANQSLDAIVCGYSKNNRDAALMVMFKAYFDDSSSDEETKIMVLAGCVQSYKVWANFSIEWEAALAQSPSIKYFHMREARHLEGEFLRWKARDRDNKIHYLASVIDSYRPWTLVVWVSRKEHDAILKPIAPFMIRHSYVALFYAVILKLAHLHNDMGIHLPVEYVFDEQGPIGEDAALWYRHIKSWQSPEIAAVMGGTPKFENDKMVLPLQAADMLAWHVRRRKERPNEDCAKFPTGPLENLTCAEVHITQDFMTKIADQMKDVPGISSVQEKPHKYDKEELRAVIRNLPTEEEWARNKSRPKR